MVSYATGEITFAESDVVLILVVVDDGLVQGELIMNTEEFNKVLILVVVDDGLVQGELIMNTEEFNKVLILVVVDDGLVHSCEYVAHHEHYES